MKIGIKRFWREPLLHFLVIGVAIFGFYDLLDEQGGEAPKSIFVKRGQVEQLAANFRRARMRSPTRDELAGLIEDLVREEVFYREALAMGLDQNDPLVRRRMRMKLEFMLEEIASEEMSDEALTAFVQEHPDKFRIPASVSFRQVYLSPEKREDLESDAKTVLASLQGGAAPESLGDATLMASEYRSATRSEIARTFGERFARDVDKLAPGGWTGPVYSSYGAHLLRVSEREEASQPPLEEIRTRVEREYSAQRRSEQKDLAYRKLREGYQVTIEAAAGGQDAESGIIAKAQASEVQEQ